MPTTTKPTLLARLLYKHGACEDGVAWVNESGAKTPAEAWEKCQKPAWMFWALEAAGISDERLFRKFMAWCARNTPLPDGRKTWDLLTDERSRRAVEVAERFAEGQATQEERSASWSAAESAAWSAAESAAAESAADSAAESAADSASWSAAESASWSAACSAAAESAARSAAWSAARSAAWSAQADALRSFMGNPFRDRKTLARLKGGA